MSIEINRLTNANVYLNGGSILGTAEEVMLPSIVHKMVEHKALGMIGTAEFFSGIEKMEAKIKWNSMYQKTMLASSNPVKSVSLQVRSSLETYDSGGRIAEVPVVCFMTAQFKSVPMGNFKQHDNVELESSLTVYAVKLEIDGQGIIEVDVLANIYKVNGEDIMATYRANLGA